MNAFFVGIGLTMVACSAALAAVGNYDGVLGTDDPAQFLVLPGEPATFRVLVTGTSEDASQAFVDYGEHMLVPQPMRDEMDLGQFVPVQVLDAPAGGKGFLAVRDVVPAPGETLVVSGVVKTQWPLYEARDDQQLASVQVLFIHPDDYHAPILFKR